MTSYSGECATVNDCDEGELCELVDGSSQCVPDPDECKSNEDCPEGQECAEWGGKQYLTCWHPDSTCTSDDSCDYNEFCEDSEGDSIFHCVDNAPLCRVGHDSQDCPDGQVCVDDNDDGRGECQDI